MKAVVELVAQHRVPLGELLRLHQIAFAQHDVKRHARLYRQDWELLFVPEGLTHMGFAVDHPVDGAALVLGTPMPEQYNLAAHERLTYSFLDLSPLPPGVVITVLLDGLVISSHALTNTPNTRYVPGSCPFLVDGQALINVGERLSGSFGRCEAWPARAR